MANDGPNTNESQYFITSGKRPHLDMKYTLFGKAIDGFDKLEELETIKDGAKYRQLVQQIIQRITIHENPLVFD